jgi:hypothetical protein
VEQIITAVVDGIVVPVTGTIPWLVSSGVLLLVFGGLWVAFGAGIVLNQGGVDQVWHWIGSQHIVVQGIAWLLFLPVLAGLWVWETGWPLVARLVVVGGLAFWSILIFLPRSTPQG